VLTFEEKISINEKQNDYEKNFGFIHDTSIHENLTNGRGT
jgi:hypothetical protein